MRDHIYLYDSLVETIPQLNTQKDPVIVDIGSGPGILLQRIRHRFPEAYLIGLDRSIDMQMVAKNLCLDRTVFLIIGDAEQIPLKNSSVDFIISRFSACYWNDIHHAFDEMDRILRSKGIGILQMINKDYSKIRLMILKTLMKIHQTPSDIRTYHIDSFKIAYSIETTLRILEKTAFRILSIDQKKNDWMYTIIFQKPDSKEK
jgi:ubiquinone/menaquinone biosynthesis C-methylase UbiE